MSTKSVIFCLLFCLSSVPVWAGAIQGKVTGVKNPSQVVVYIKTANGTFTPPAEHPVLDQKNKIYIPHVLPVLKGTTVDILNSDNVLHNVNSPIGPTKFNIAMPVFKKKIEQIFDKVGVHPLLCNVHPEMSAFVVVLENPYFTRPSDDGSYQLKAVPADTYTLEAWDEHKKIRSQQVSVTGSATTVDFTF